VSTATPVDLTGGTIMTIRQDSARTQVLSAGSLIGTAVVNAAGESLGSIEEIMLHTDTGDVAYAVLSFGGFLGIGDKLFAVPWEALTIDSGRERIVLDVDRDRLEHAPGFDKDNWPLTADSAWMSEVHGYYGYEYAPRRRR
jgi:sporulation protein YlmC with PRC-barrel domain